MNDGKISLQVVKAAILAGVTKSVPIPFLDSYLFRKVKERMVAGIAIEFDVNQNLASLRPLYAPPRGCLMNIVVFILATPFLPFIFIYKLTIKIIRMIFFFLKIRDVALIMGDTLMLGHTVKRCLNDGRIPRSTLNNPTTTKATYKASVKVRRVFEKSYKGSDFRLVGKLLTDLTLTILKSHKILLLGIKTIFRSNSTTKHSRAEHPCPPIPTLSCPPPPLPTSKSNDNKIGYFAEQLAELLNHHDMKLFIKDFDARFDIMFSGSKTL